jgi:hypothetical protein
MTSLSRCIEYTPKAASAQRRNLSIFPCISRPSAWERSQSLSIQVCTVFQKQLPELGTGHPWPRAKVTKPDAIEVLIRAWRRPSECRAHEAWGACGSRADRVNEADDGAIGDDESPESDEQPMGIGAEPMKGFAMAGLGVIAGAASK